MTVQVTDRLSQLYVGNGVNTRFDFTFRIFDQEDETGVAVRIQIGNEFEFLDETKYTVTINPDNLGGYVNFLDAPDGQTYFYIAGKTPVDQLLDITNYDNFYPDAIERALDKLTAILQEWKHLVDFETQARILADLNYDELAQQREAELKAYIDGIASAITGQPVLGLPAKFVVDGGENQEQINDKTIQFLPTISQLLTYKPRKDGQLVVVKSYLGVNKEGGGKFVFKAGDATLVNNVTVFNAIGGRWFRYGWKNPDIYDAGLDGSETDASTRFQALIDAATNLNLSVSLRGKSIKINQLDIPDNMHIFNGGLDVTASPFKNDVSNGTYGRAALMLKNTDRNAVGIDYEVQQNYLPLAVAKNIKFVKIKFIADQYAGLFYKFDGLEFIKCSGYWNSFNLFKFIGGWHGTPLVNDTPNSYNLIDPINGRCKNIICKDSDWFGGYINRQYSSPFRFIACEDVQISGGKNNCPLGWHIDMYNRGFTLNVADYVNTNQQIVIDSIAGIAHADMLALYVGQNSYDINVFGGRWKDFGIKGAYIENGSQVTIDGVVVRCTNPNSVATFVDLQPNWRNAENTYWGNVADINIKNNTVNGVRFGVTTSQFGGVRSLRGIHIENNLIVTNSNLTAIGITGTEDYTVANNNCNGSLFLGRNNGGGAVSKNRFASPSNYALYIDRQLTGILPYLVNNEFYVDSGDVIYNNGGEGKTGQITGGNIQSGNGGHIFALGEAANITCYAFENGLTQRQMNFSQNINVPANGSTTYTKNIAGVKEGWTASMSVHGILDLGYDLSFLVSCKSNQIVFKVRNNTGSAVNFDPNLLLNLNSFADQVFIN
ncbi:hypothetical protein WAI95_11200 [Acinetobacter baumannii]|uniref:hypothetical protein n=1 Tax=Acinetobacter TaxID=469 RepID=UPI001E292C0C|nr:MULTISPECIES: hypothetical protein [Acinetobacter]MCZ2980979.1 hypothetical protein [Acinetobacter baumannii]MCZ3047804.1 hypothetical protein [Acinetobacter baumannii]MCZ3191385.1 hypothetical protein [Acinetobacter baumannii]MDA3487983.1 hypothetical protein [Acinetobacter sp. AOR31_HL]MDR9519196.1 hypothetical protein [Acinetobacter baumannii]